jgi:DNA-binding XRE family transcriptional regulator
MKNNVKVIRGIKGLTQEELAQLLGLSSQTLILLNQVIMNGQQFYL